MASFSQLHDNEGSSTEQEPKLNLLARCGLSLSGSPWRGLFLFPLILLGSQWLVVAFVVSPVADTMLQMLPVPIAKAPHLVAFGLVGVTVFTGVLTILVLYWVAPAGYDNHTPRKMKSPSEMADQYPTLFRLQSAHNNSYECLALLAPCLWIADSLDLEQVIFAKLSVLLLVMRILYILMYVLNEDILRTTCFVLGFVAITEIGICAIFPSTLSKYEARSWLEVRPF